jgi:hypothetical protein
MRIIYNIKYKDYMKSKLTLKMKLPAIEGDMDKGYTPHIRKRSQRTSEINIEMSPSIISDPSENKRLPKLIWHRWVTSSVEK